MRNLGERGKLNSFNIQWRGRQQVGSNDMEQKAKIGKVMGGVQDNRGK